MLSGRTALCFSHTASFLQPKPKPVVSGRTACCFSHSTSFFQPKPTIYIHYGSIWVSYSGLLVRFIHGGWPQKKIRAREVFDMPNER